LESCGTRQRAPFKTVITNGFVLDEKGYKMSKSLGNTVSPQDVCNEMGADIFRLWAATSDYTEDLRLGPEVLKSASDLYRRIRNTFRFLLGATEGFTEKEKQSLSTPGELPELEQYILHRVYEVDQKLKEYIHDFAYLKMVKLLHDFCNEDLSAFYFDIRKDSLYCDDPDSQDRKITRTVMAELFNVLTAWFAPILCFTTEEAWSYRSEGVFENCESVHLRQFPKIPSNWQNNDLAESWQNIIKTRDQVLVAIEALRADKKLRSSLEACPVITTELKDVIERTELMSDICITSQVQIIEGKNAISIELAKGDKCGRCWKIMPEVESSPENLCTRCESVVTKIRKKAAA
jgi:isoleucyl-tRNA synthetase